MEMEKYETLFYLSIGILYILHNFVGHKVYLAIGILYTLFGLFVIMKRKQEQKLSE